MTEQEINNLIDSKIGKTKMSQLPEATQTSGLYSIGYNGNQSVKYKANLLQGDPLTVRKTYQTEALAIADKNPIDTTTLLPLKVGQFVSIVDDGEKNGIYRIASISGDGTMSLELQGKLGDLSDYATLKEVDDYLALKADQTDLVQLAGDVIAGNAILNEEKLSKKIGQNKFNKNSPTNLLLHGLNSVGQPIVSANKNTSHLIPISENTNYTANAADIRCFYDEKLNFISWTTTGDYKFMTPNNSRYMRCVVSLQYWEIFQVVEGDEGKPYKEYVEYEPLEYKADKIEVEQILNLNITNKITNGNFSKGSPGWTRGASSDSINVVDDTMVVTNGSSYYFGFFQNKEIIAGHIYYACHYILSDGFEKLSMIMFQKKDATFGDRLATWENPAFENNVFHRVSATFVTESNGTVFKMGAQTKSEGAEVSIKYKNVLLLDLTEMFGVGNEPSKEIMDKLIDVVGWWNSEKKLSLKDIANWRNKISDDFDYRIKVIENNDVEDEMEISPKLRQMIDHDLIVTIGYDDASKSIYDYAFPVHQAHNVPGTFWVTTGIVEGDREEGSWGDVVTWEQLREMEQSGIMTIGGHSNMHIAYGGATPAQLHADLSAMKEIFLREGFNPKYMSYPGGSSSILAQQYVSAYFHAARGANVHSGFHVGQNSYDANKYYTDSVSIDTPSVENIKGILTTAKNKKSQGEMVWIDLFMHMISPTGLSTAGGVVKTPDQLSEIIQYVKDNNGLIISFDDAIKVFMEYSHWAEHSMFKLK